jgi:NAD(P)-dependent dehydrogenase (short-subunit alcohol dehydrogenase family)
MSLLSLTTYRKSSYAAISPTRPELSQAGKTILITGGNSGIGYAIAQGFITAASKRVIILGRRGDVVQSAATKLAEEASRLGSGTIVDGRVCDISSLAATEALWVGLLAEGIVIDVLVLNAAAGGNRAPILETGRDAVWANFEANVRSALDLSERFYKQPAKGADSRKVRNCHRRLVLHPCTALTSCSWTSSS